MKTDGIELNSFTKIYDSSSPEIKACDGINFCAPHGKITGLLGLNGAGKTTMLKAICGLHYPTEGSVSVYGCSKPEEIKKITGYAGESVSFDRNLSVFEILFRQCLLFGLKKDEALEAVKKAAAFTEIQDVLSVNICELSKGYRQRAAISRAVCTGCRALVLDEFSSGLDPSQIVKIRKSIKEFSRNAAVVFSTHHIDEAQALCDYIYIIHHGKILSSGTISQIIENAGAKNLEDAFIRLTEK